MGVIALDRNCRACYLASLLLQVMYPVKNIQTKKSPRLSGQVLRGCYWLIKLESKNIIPMAEADPIIE